jgi:hypothetical protein
MVAASFQKTFTGNVLHGKPYHARYQEGQTAKEKFYRRKSRRAMKSKNKKVSKAGERLKEYYLLLHDDVQNAADDTPGVVHARKINIGNLRQMRRRVEK